MDDEQPAVAADTAPTWGDGDDGAFPDHRVVPWRRKEGDNPGAQIGIREFPEVEDTLDHHDREPVQDYRNMADVEEEGSQGLVDMRDHNMAAEEEGTLDYNQVEAVWWGYSRKVEADQIP